MFQVGDRIENGSGKRADILRVSKDGSRIYIEFWTEGFGATPRRMRLWDYAKSWRLVRPALRAA